MKIRTVINEAKGILSIGILLSIAYTMIKDGLSQKGGIKAVKNFKISDKKEADHIMN